VRRASATPQAQGRLRYLDFYDGLLTAGGNALAPGLALDGTHLSPAYLPLLQAALGQLPPPAP